MIKNFKELQKETEKKNRERARTYWERGVASYTAELLENIKNNKQEAATAEQLTAQMLNGASSWNEYSWGGCSLIYDADICETLATPSEQKRTRNGERKPNGHEEWLDVQARALSQAGARIRASFKVLNLKKEI